MCNIDGFINSWRYCFFVRDDSSYRSFLYFHCSFRSQFHVSRSDRSSTPGSFDIHVTVDLICRNICSFIRIISSRWSTVITRRILIEKNCTFWTISQRTTSLNQEATIFLSMIRSESPDQDRSETWFIRFNGGGRFGGRESAYRFRIAGPVCRRNYRRNYSQRLIY